MVVENQSARLQKDDNNASVDLALHPLVAEQPRNRFTRQATRIFLSPKKPQGRVRKVHIPEFDSDSDADGPIGARPIEVRATETLSKKRSSASVVRQETNESSDDEASLQRPAGQPSKKRSKPPQTCSASLVSKTKEDEFQVQLKHYRDQCTDARRKSAKLSIELEHVRDAYRDALKKVGEADLIEGVDVIVDKKLDLLSIAKVPVKNSESEKATSISAPSKNTKPEKKSLRDDDDDDEDQRHNVVIDFSKPDKLVKLKFRSFDGSVSVSTSVT